MIYCPLLWDKVNRNSPEKREIMNLNLVYSFICHCTTRNGLPGYNYSFISLEKYLSQAVAVGR